jgi:prepilin-type N-terminal cleavage/methylation domain-containing protein
LDRRDLFLKLRDQASNPKVNVHLHELADWKAHAMLQNSLRKHRDGEAGFTLVELLVVIVILGVLAGIVVFAVGGVNQKSKASACNADVATVQAAEEAYAAQHSNAYTDIPGLVTATYLRAAPLTTNGYTVAASATTGAVTTTPLCSTL